MAYSQWLVLSGICACICLSCGDDGRRKGKNQDDDVKAPREVGIDEGIWLVTQTSPTADCAEPAEAGDLNGDGFGDLTCAGGEELGHSHKSRFRVHVHVFYGPIEDLGDPDQSMSLADEVVYKTGEINYYFFWSVAEPGDVSGDGIDDLVLGMSETLDESVAIVVLNGNAEGIAPLEPSVTIEVEGDYGLIDVSNLGDVTGDGYNDLAWTDAELQAVRLIPGPIRSDRVPVEYLTALPSGYVKHTIPSGGDVDGDGFSDFLIANSDSVGLYSSPISIPLYFDSFTASYDFFGDPKAVSLGDTNGDGYSDLVIGPRVYDGPAFSAHYGFDEYSFRAIYSDEYGEFTEDDYLLQSAATGDMDADGSEEIIVAFDASTGYMDDDRRGVFLFTGPLSGTLTTLEATAVFGQGQASVPGYPGGDTNGDGFDDLLVSSRLYLGGEEW